MLKKCHKIGSQVCKCACVRECMGGSVHALRFVASIMSRPKDVTPADISKHGSLPTCDEARKWLTRSNLLCRGAISLPLDNARKWLTRSNLAASVIYPTFAKEVCHLCLLVECAYTSPTPTSRTMCLQQPCHTCLYPHKHTLCLYPHKHTFISALGGS
jgi:hypothetical protein